MAKQTYRQPPPVRPSMAPPTGVLPRPVIPQVNQFPDPITKTAKIVRR